MVGSTLAGAKQIPALVAVSGNIFALVENFELCLTLMTQCALDFLCDRASGI